jgi:hypothetical protein
MLALGALSLPSMPVVFPVCKKHQCMFVVLRPQGSSTPASHCKCFTIAFSASSSASRVLTR